MWGCTFVDTQFPFFIFLPSFSFFGGCLQLCKYYAYRFPILRRRGKARGLRICSSFWIGVRRFLASPPLSLSLTCSKAGFTDDISLPVFPAFWCRIFFARNVLSFIFPTCLLTLLCVFSNFSSSVFSLCEEWASRSFVSCTAYVL